MKSAITTFFAKSLLARHLDGNYEGHDDWDITNIIHAELIPRDEAVAKGEVGMMASAMHLEGNVDKATAEDHGVGSRISSMVMWFYLSNG